MPAGGVDHRSRELALLATLAHKRYTDPRIGKLLEACEKNSSLTSDPHSDSAANLREIRHDFDRRTKLPSEHVGEIAQTGSKAHHEWQQARADNDFDRFRPWLEKNIELSRKSAGYYGWGADEEPWDALAEGYETGMRAANIETIFTPLRDRLQSLLTDLMSGSKGPTTKFDDVEVAPEQQMAFVRSISERIGFDYGRGRIDPSAHPFCGGTHYGDVRITTRFKPNMVGDALMSTMHETGHGIYEQGLPPEHEGTPIGRVRSLGLHESQSRMWENFVGRSEAFWRWCLPVMKEELGSPVADLTHDDVYGGMNRVEPSLIRVEADEATYNMHIMIRFELERALIGGSPEARDLPNEWNLRYKEYLGVDVPDDARGCMQDIHWSGGSFGYFPTYTLGNLYAAQIFEKVLSDIPDLHAKFEEGEFAPLKDWLNENMHRHGGRYLPSELCERLTGKPLGADPLLRHLEGKLRPLYSA